jgi:histidyl-tRNA synthetase
MPACGFGMGDVVLSLVLQDKGLLKPEEYMPCPHAFVIAASDQAEAKMREIVTQLRRGGFHIRHSYKTTRNVGKLLGEASKARAISAIIVGKDIAEDRVDLKDLQSGQQETIALGEIEAKLKELIARHEVR